LSKIDEKVEKFPRAVHVHDIYNNFDPQQYCVLGGLAGLVQENNRRAPWS